VLVDQQDAYVLSLGRESIKRCLDGRVVGLAINDEEILLGIGRGSNMLPKSTVSVAVHQFICFLSRIHLPRCLQEAVPSLSPANPVSH
jgi:hypothetical protein